MDASPLSDLLARAEAASSRMGRKNPHRELLHDLCVTMVALAQRVAMLEQEKAEKPRIVLP